MIKINELSSHEKRWKNLKWKRERSQSEKCYTRLRFQFYDILEKAKLRRKLKDPWLPRVYEGKGWGRDGRRDEYMERRGFLGQ